MERREHCIKIHKFPKKYRFDNMQHYTKEDESKRMEIDVDDKIKKKSTKIFLKNQKSKMFPKGTTSIVCENNVSLEIPTTNIKAKITTPLVFVPRQVQKSFSKVLTNNQNREKNVLESEVMTELANSLPD